MFLQIIGLITIALVASWLLYGFKEIVSYACYFKDYASIAIGLLMGFCSLGLFWYVFQHIVIIVR